MGLKPFLCFAHRGASGHAPENTLAAFDLAVNMNSHWIELDVYCVESELIVIHDELLDRTTDGSGPVMAQTLAQLQPLDAGLGQNIPTLAQVIELIDHRARINIELKGPDTAIATNHLLKRYCDRGWHAEEFLISSFNHRELVLADPIYPRGVLFHKALMNTFERAEALSAYSINLGLNFCDLETVTAAHTRGLKVFVYTVNETADMLSLEAMGVDGIFTNYPDRFFARHS